MTSISATTTTESFESKKKSSTCSSLMHSVAKGDNLALPKDDSMILSPCCEGRELQGDIILPKLFTSRLEDMFKYLDWTDRDKNNGENNASPFCRRHLVFAGSVTDLQTMIEELYIRSFIEHFWLHRDDDDSANVKIEEELVRCGLSAISLKHDTGLTQRMCLPWSYDQLYVKPGILKHRNSFRSLQKPDLRQVPYLRRMTAEELKMLFSAYSDFHSNYDVKGGKLAGEKHTETISATVKPEAVLQNNKKTKKAMCDNIGGAKNLPQKTTTKRPEAKSKPSAIQLHSSRARAKLYTSVLAGFNTADRLVSVEIKEPCNQEDMKVPEDLECSDDDNEQLQMILPPRHDDSDIARA